MVNPSTESILNQMTNLAMDIAMDYVLPASPMSDVCKNDLFEFEREVVAAVSNGVTGGLMGNLVASTVGTTGGCCGRPPTDLCKKNSYMGAAGCDSCYSCVAKRVASSTSNSPSRCSSGSKSSSSSSSSQTTTTTPSSQHTAETTMDISWCQYDGCEFDTVDNTYLDICDWIFYADRYALTDENREKVQKAFQMVPPGEVTGYVVQPPEPNPTESNNNNIKAENPAATVSRPRSPPPAIPLPPYEMPVTIKTEIKSEPDDDYLWTSDNHLQPIILKAEPNADILQITELDHSYLQTTTNVNNGPSSCHPSTTVVLPTKHHHPNHLVDMLGLVTPPPSRSQSSGKYRLDRDLPILYICFLIIMFAIKRKLRV